MPSISGLGNQSYMAPTTSAPQPSTPDDIVANSSLTQGLDPALLQANNAPDQMGQDMFLQLLVAQLKYQNPLSPMDGSEFMAQTAQFTTVEKLQELTSQLTESLANDRLGTATGMIGRQVTYTGLDGVQVNENVTGVRFGPTGPVLLTSSNAELTMSQIEQVSARETG